MSLDKLPLRTRKAIARRWALQAMAVTIEQDLANGSGWIEADADELGLALDTHREVLDGVAAELRKQSGAPLGGRQWMRVPAPGRRV